jgi:hypothetical protein
MRYWIILIIDTFFFLPIYGQVDMKVADDVQQRWQNVSPEQVYILPSKGVYETGEDMWFKAWVLNRSDFTLSGRSRTLYLRIYSLSDSVVWDEKYPISGGRTDGHVFIGENWKEGEYRIEGYTKSSFYTGITESLYPRKIFIVKSVMSKDSLLSISRREALHPSPQNKAFRFGLYPEGGTLVCGVRSLVAFKSSDGYGFPVIVGGDLYEDGIKVQSLKTEHDGMGSFSFVPRAGSSYRVRLSDGRDIPMPSAVQNGMVLHLERISNEYVLFKIIQPFSGIGHRITLLAQMRGMSCCVASSLLRDSLLIALPLKEFASQGIAEVTLYDEFLHPVSERLLYVNPGRVLKITANPEKGTYFRREGGKLSIHVCDEHGAPVKAEVCVSIFDKSYENPLNHETMLSYNLLSTQIRGNIYNSSYYFDSRNEDRFRALDLLLLTQGWRRYTWESDSTISAGRPFLSDGIAGSERVGKKCQKKMPNGGVQMVKVSGSDGKSQLLWTDSLGCFEIVPSLMSQFRGGYIYVRPMLDKGYKPRLSLTDTSLQIDSIRRFSPEYAAFIGSEKKKSEEDVHFLKGLGGTILLKDVTVTKKREVPYRDKYMGRLDSLAQADFAAGCWVCTDGPQVIGSVGHLNDYLPGYTHHPAGSPISNYKGKKLKPERGKLYELIKYELKEDGKWHIVDIRSIRYGGSLYTNEELLRMYNIQCTKAYYAKREFYNPDLSDIHSSLPDARNTLLWSPSVMTDKEGNAILEFWTSDINTRFTGIVEGTDGNGLLGSGSFEMNVVKMQ